MACVIASWISTLEGKSRCNWVSDARQEGKQAKAKARRPNDERPSKVGNYGEGRVCDKQAATALTTFTSLASYSVGACCRASSKTRMQRPMESASESLISRQDTEAGEVPAGDAHDVRMHGAHIPSDASVKGPSTVHSKASVPHPFILKSIYARRRLRLMLLPLSNMEACNMLPQCRVVEWSHVLDAEIHSSS